MKQRGSPSLEERPERDAPQEDRKPGVGRALRRSALLAWLFSGTAHGLVFTALFWPPAATPPPQPPPILVSLVEVPKPDPPGPPDEPPGPPAATEVKAELPQKPVQSKAPRRSAPAPAADSEPAPDTFADLLSESDLAGAASADAEGGGGGGGGGCDMARAVQQALRRDPLVRMAVGDANRLGKSIMLWNGDWVRSGRQDGKGLSAVREAVLWEVAFAPAACRNKPVHGLVLLSLQDGNTRFAIGAGDWRWSDLLDVRPPVR